MSLAEDGYFLPAAFICGWLEKERDIPRMRNIRHSWVGIIKDRCVGRKLNITAHPGHTSIVVASHNKMFGGLSYSSKNGFR